jgi:hypothetical protein
MARLIDYFAARLHSAGFIALSVPIYMRVAKVAAAAAPFFSRSRYGAAAAIWSSQLCGWQYMETLQLVIDSDTSSIRPGFHARAIVQHVIVFRPLWQLRWLYRVFSCAGIAQLIENRSSFKKWTQLSHGNSVAISYMGQLYPRGGQSWSLILSDSFAENITRDDDSIALIARYKFKLWRAIISLNARHGSWQRLFLGNFKPRTTRWAGSTSTTEPACTSY